MTPLPILIDTDIGNDPDDLLALAMVLDHPDLYDLKGIVTTGNAPELRAEFVRCLCAVADRPEIPIGIGCDIPQSNPPTDFHREYFPTHAPAYRDETRFTPWQKILGMLTPEITLVTIGPLTTFAAYLRTEPNALKNLGSVVSMGGFVSRHNPKPISEYNFGIDPKATCYVLNLSFRHICVTKNICQNIRMNKYDIARLSSARKTARSWAFRFLAEWFERKDFKTLL